MLSFQNNNKKIYMVRIIGNTLPDINDPLQNLKNLEYILNNEENLEGIEKIWVLNRIIDKNMENKYISLLKKFNMNYDIIPFNIKDFNKIKRVLLKNILKDIKNNMKSILYISNINSARNYVLNKYRSKSNYNGLDEYFHLNLILINK